MKQCTETESVQRQPPPPVCPEKPDMPRLYHLRDIAKDVTLPWTWDSDTGEGFVLRWNEDVVRPEFKEKLMHLPYWWIRKKVGVPVCFF